eukprot:4136025-Pyramimonas_sp.AAC.1
MAPERSKRPPRRPEGAVRRPKRPPRRPRWPPRRQWNTPREPQFGSERPPKRLPTVSDGPGAHQDGPR